jgi:hypothetical protein
MGYRSHTLVAILALIPFAGGCTTAVGLAPSASTTTIVGWERWLRLEWSVQASGMGHDIEGYVYSQHGSTAENVRLLAQGLDASGNVVASKLEWLGGPVPGLQNSYFRFSKMPAAERYRVSVWAFDSVATGTFCR